jgi:hypothetical protein
LYPRKRRAGYRTGTRAAEEAGAPCV